MKKKIELQPIIYKDSWHRDLSKIIYQMIKISIFDPLIKETDILKVNAKEKYLEDALKKGILAYKDGYFLGNLDSKISKEIKNLGGKFRKGKWYIDFSMLPEKIRNIIENKHIELRKLELDVFSKFEDMTKDIEKLISLTDFSQYADYAIDRVSKEFKRTVKEKLAVLPNISEEGENKLRDRYFLTENLPIRENTVADFKAGLADSVTNFAQEIVEKLRLDIGQKIADGIPRNELSKFIKSRLKISKQRSDFIARQETALLTVEIKRQQYEQFGINKYKWVTMGDHKVRERHVELNNKIIDWKDPPIVDEKTGRRAHAGQDFRCRCVDKPIIEW